MRTPLSPKNSVSWFSPAFRKAYRYRTLYDLVVGSVKGRRLLQDAVDKNGNRQLRKRIFSGMHFKNHLIAACFGDVQQIPGAHALLGAQLCQIELCLFFYFCLLIKFPAIASFAGLLISSHTSNSRSQKRFITGERIRK